MAKLIDLIVFTTGYLLVVYGILSKYLSKKLAIIITSCTFVFVLCVLIIRNLKPKRKEMHVEETPIYLALMPRDKQTELFYSLVPDERKISINTPYFLYQNGDDRVLVATLYRFLNLTQEDIASAYREGIKEKVSEIIILTRARERKTLTLTALLPIRFTFPDKYTVHRALKKHNALPPKPERPKRVKIKADKEFLLTTILDGRRAKLYMLSALILSLLSFITPLKNYYLISAIVPFLLAVVCYFRKNNRIR